MSKKLYAVLLCNALFIGCDQSIGPDALDIAVRKHNAGAVINYDNPSDHSDTSATGYGYLVDGRKWRSTGEDRTNTHRGHYHNVRDAIAAEMNQGTD